MQHLHSTVVLLKVSIKLLGDDDVRAFTFYCSSIKGKHLFYVVISKELFTFYCSSIKGFVLHYLQK